MIAAILIFLAWGSYLNSLGYRLLNTQYFLKIRSFCPTCLHHIAWYDNIPLCSWFLLAGKCRYCKQPISWLYPFIECITTMALFLLWCYSPARYFASYALFFSALIITIRTDLDAMLISRFTTIYLVPVGFISAYYNLLPISLYTSLMGACFGYAVLWTTKKINTYLTGQDGMGQGDLELLACIGSFTGIFGCWIALSIGSIAGTLLTVLYMYIKKVTIKKIPFGAYLAGGAMIFTLYQDMLVNYFFTI